MQFVENYHTHTYRCKHAEGDIADYVQAAADAGFQKLGFADHTPLPDNWTSMIRMEMSDLEGYIAAVNKEKSKPHALKVFCGLECDYYPEYESFYKELSARPDMDYLVGSIHSFSWKGERHWLHPGFTMEKEHMKPYAEFVVKAMESGLFKFIAHPDTFGLSLHVWNSEVRPAMHYIAEAAASLGIPLEINTSGFDKSVSDPEKYLPVKYPLEQFWEIAAEYPVQVVINSDAHKPSSIPAYLDAGERLRKKYGLEKAVIF